MSVIEYFQLVKVWKLLGNGKGEEKNVVLSKEIFYYDYYICCALPFVPNCSFQIIFVSMDSNKITAEMSLEQKYSLYHHPCVEYWIVTIIIFTVVGILVNKRRYVRDES